MAAGCSEEKEMAGGSCARHDSSTPVSRRWEASNGSPRLPWRKYGKATCGGELILAGVGSLAPAPTQEGRGHEGEALLDTNRGMVQQLTDGAAAAI
jgi:hypothetical protein